MRVEDTFRFAATALMKQPRRAGLSLLGVVIGVVAVLCLTALGEGARRYVTDQFQSLGTDIIVVSEYGLLNAVASLLLAEGG